MAGPQKAAPVQPGDSYLLVNDRDQDMEACNRAPGARPSASRNCRGGVSCPLLVSVTVAMDQQIGDRLFLSARTR